MTHAAAAMLKLLEPGSRSKPLNVSSWAWVPILALLPLVLYLALGYGGHDFQYHVSSWMELHDSWSAHQWRLGWAQSAQYGFGEPRFCFYPPLSLWIGTLLTFLLPFRLVPGVVVWLVLSLGGLAMYKSSAYFIPQKYRVAAAILYMFNPYFMMTVILRYAIAEAWVQALLPLTFLYFYLVVAEGRLRLVGLAGCLIAAGWLTNIPEAIALFYAFNFLAVALTIRTKSLKPIGAAILTQTIALLLSAFRLLPVFSEKGWVTSQNLLIYNFRAYMQLSKTPPPHLLIYLTGAYMLLAISLIFLAVRSSLQQGYAWSAAAFALVSLAAFACALQLPISSPIWQSLPQFKFILFPYRLLPLPSLACVTLLFAESVPSRLRRGGSVGLLLLALAVFPCYTRLFPFQRFHSLGVSLSSWHSGYKGVKEYVPARVPDAGNFEDTEPGLAKRGPFSSDACNPILLRASPNEKLVATRNAEPCSLVLNTFYYPFWKANIVDGVALSVLPSRLGLLSVALPAGLHQVRFEFVPATKLRTVSIGLSIAMLFSVLMYTWLAPTKPHAATVATDPPPQQHLERRRTA